MGGVPVQVVAERAPPSGTCPFDRKLGAVTIQEWLPKAVRYEALTDSISLFLSR